MKNIISIWNKPISPVISFIMTFIMGLLISNFAFKYSFWIFLIAIPYLYQLIFLVVLKHKVAELLSAIGKLMEMIRNATVPNKEENVD
jgi:hypothetical protein